MVLPAPFAPMSRQRTPAGRTRSRSRRTGGSEAAYPGYIPKGEIWLDDALHVLDRIATIFHEIVERNLMLYQGIGYDRAHDTACKREIEFRKELIQKQPTSTDLRLVARALRPYAKEAIPSGKRPGRASRTIGSL